jgi:uncharacterized OsmC-like protein
MPTIKSTYLGQLRSQAIHLQSGTSILTDAPTDNMGKGEAFSPTDLTATSLGTCIITTMAIVAQRDGIDLEGSTMEITKVMSNSAPRRIAQIDVVIDLKTNRALSDEECKKLEKTAHVCPVSLSLHPDVKQVIQISWPKFH